MPSKTPEEPKASLPTGHPQAGYVGPDLSFRDQAGGLPPESQAAYDEMVAAHEDEVAAVEDAEDKAVKAAQKAAEKEEAAPKAASKASS